MLRWNHLLYL